MAFTSKQLDAIEQMMEAADAFVHAFAQDYPIMTATVQAKFEGFKTWADGSPVPESKP